jgi:hypothetical protein
LKLTKEQANVQISLYPYKESTSFEYPFDINLAKQSIFPMRLFINNQSSKEIVVKRDSVILKNANNQYQQLSVDNILLRIQYSPPARYFGWALGISLPTLGIGLIPGIIVGIVDGNNAVTANEAIRKDIYEKGIKNQILPNGESVDGFLYFDVPEEKQHDSFTIIIELKMKESDPLLFEFAI